MTEEDQDSNFDEAHEVEPIKVSVKFKSQERVAESEVKFLDNKDTFQDVNRNESSSENQLKEAQITCDNSDSRHVCLPIDTSATSIPLAAAAAGKARNDVFKLEGWKGYGNNIYIRPIIVNNATRGMSSVSGNGEVQRKLTTEDLRKKKLQDANIWVHKYNAKYQCIGSLRTKVQLLNQEKKTTRNSLKQTKGIEKPDKEKIPSKIQKGLACRTWAVSFPSKNARTKTKSEEFASVFGRQYTENTKSLSEWNAVDAKKKMAQTNQASPKTISSEGTREQTTPARIIRLEIDLREKSSGDENDSTDEQKIKTKTESFQSVPSSSFCDIKQCFCGEKITRDNKVKRSYSTSFDRPHPHRSRSVVALPIKQFPPINPLEVLKKSSVSLNPTRGVLPIRRPRTVDTARLSRELIIINGHFNLPNYVNKSHLRNGCYVQRGLRRSSEDISQRKVFYTPWVDFKRDNFVSGNFDNLSLIDREAPHYTRNFEKEKQKTGDKNARKAATQKSVSNIRGNKKWTRDKRNESEHILRIRNTLGNRGPQSRTLPHSTKSDQNQSDSDSNDTGLGSEIEYAVDGSTKLDVFLQPRRNSCY
ncbi:uncharacterized protein LOC141892237 [Acropora palmata]|uniref:uncharacterized protein LOC141892237 n=1 Tax=Acropora palmata TaxID=6131 RepID=UPI003DA1402B